MPKHTRPIPQLSQSDWARFWKSVSASFRDSECRLWTGCKDRYGYGQIGFGSHVRDTFQLCRAHRVSFFIAHGRQPVGDLMHSCDTPACVNPDHLRECTPLENLSDMRKKGRWNRIKRKLTDDDIRTIRALGRAGLKHGFIANQFGLSQPFTTRIINKNRWAGVH